MNKNISPTQEPSAELRLLAELYVERHHQLCALSSDQLMRNWCKYLELKAPEILEQPLIHLANVIVTAKRRACRACEDSRITA